MKRKSLSVLLTLSLILSAFASFGTSAQAASIKTKFPDVKNEHWAIMHIYKLAALGVISGDSNGKFRPEDKVRQQDVIIMALRYMGYSDDDISKELSNKRFTLDVEVDDYAKDEVFFATEIGLLDLEEEKMILEDDEKFGTKSASREWASKILIRVIDKEDEIDNMEDKLGTFTDRSEVSDWAESYMNAAVNLELIRGMNSGKLAPKNNVTRAQMATLLSQADDYVDLGDLHITGRVNSITEDSISVIDSEGDVQEFDLNVTTNYFYNNKKVTQDEIESFYEVAVIAHSNTAYYVEILNKSKYQVHEGILYDVDYDDKTITLDQDGKLNDYTFMSSTTFVDNDGKGLNFSDLITKSQVKLNYDPQSDDGKIKQIVLVQAPVSKKSKGTIVKIEDDEISIHDKENNEIETYEVADDMKVVYGDKELTSAQLGLKDEVEYIVESDVLEKISITEPNEPIREVKEGFFISFSYDSSLNSNILNIRINDQPQVYYVSKDVAVILGSQDYATVEDLSSNDLLRIELDQYSKVTKIEVPNRSLEFRQLQTIDFISSDTMRMFFKESNELYYYDENTPVYVDDEVLNIVDALDENELKEGLKVDVMVSGDKIFSITVNNDYDGLITEVNLTKNTITIKSKDDTERVFDMGSNISVYRSDASTGNKNNLKVGAPVRITLDSQQEKVSKVYIKSLMWYEITDINTSYNELKLEDANGKDKKVKVNSSFLIFNQKGDLITLADLDEGDTLIGVYVGKSLKEVYLNESKSGRVTDMNQNLDTFSLEDYNGQNYTIKNVYDVDIDVQDRVEVLTAADLVLIQEIEPMDKTFWKLSNDKLYVKRKNLQNEKYIFSISSLLTVKDDDGNTIKLSDLDEGDKIEIYVTNGEVVEIVQD
ncbi:S-layer homology domain-containing protein [Longirhabdus pacifica]|uniref:S-layer homology domain-containing protein n=1 Tax=Longirhabdus pacifica TaxID=2305227 RepID=UPI0013E8CCB8|nr:S-layer homology domain-containing protein [Longirhabdus pacifica]